MTYDLPNPFLFLSPLSAGNAAPVENPTPSPSAGAAPAYPCCPDCGMCEPCDQHCPNAALPGLTISRAGDALDEAAFLSEIEPVPAFISRPVDEYQAAVDKTVADIARAEIEQLLELARAEEWPAPPRRMVG